MAPPIKPHAETIKDTQKERELANAGYKSDENEIEFLETEKIDTIAPAKVATRAKPEYPRSRKAVLKLKSAPSFDPLTIGELFPEYKETRKDTLRDDFSGSMIAKSLRKTRSGATETKTAN